MDRVALNIHGNANSHIGALCHVIFDGILCNGISAGAVTAEGATELSVEVAGGGIVGCGLLLDIRRVRRVPWLEPGNDTAASAAEGIDFPVHVLAVHAMGLHLLDWLQFDDLAAVCEELNRWSFLCVVAPLQLRPGTGSPANPIAIF